jgi:dephospho-CoA kinase
VLKIGLTGGIGAGKSAAAGRLAEHGAVVIDADLLAHEVVETFGSQVLAADGSLDRSVLADTVFADETSRQRLEAIIHPRVRARTAELTRAAPAGAIVVNDVPLLVEAGLAATYHLVVVVSASLATRVHRLVEQRGMSEHQARARLSVQTDDASRWAAADVLLTNNGSLAELYDTVDALWRDRLVPYQENIVHRRQVWRPEQLHVGPYDPSWPAQYARLAGRIAHAAGDAALRVDHIGSTAVPGLDAKDVIDIQLTVPDLSVAGRLTDPLAEAGFPRAEGIWHDSPKPDAPDPTAWSKHLHGGADPARIVHLHVRPVRSPGVRLSLLLRDWLRADPAARAEYAAFKHRLAAAGLSTSAYGAAKEPWFDGAWARAEQWATATGWTLA